MTGWIVQTLAASTLLMLAVMALRPFLRCHVAPGLVYALWLFPALRLAMPSLPFLPAGSVAAPEAVGLPLGGEVATAAVPTAAILVAVWLAGAALHLGWQLFLYARFVAVARAGVVGIPRRVGAVHILHSTGVEGPVALGIWRRTVFLPADFGVQFDAEERRLAIAHELTHHRRHDVLANLAATTVLSLHWFNPLAHLAYRLFREDQELACDADVIAAEGGAQRHAYGRILVKASSEAPTALCTLSDVAFLKMRLGGLGRATPASGRLATWIVGGLAASGLVLSAAAPAALPRLQASAPPAAASAVQEVRTAARPPVPAL
ncbi:MAG: M56 family metallopeptidase, partial [Sphingomonas sp.]